MSSIHRINQEDPLQSGGEPEQELSQSEFPDRGGAGAESPVSSQRSRAPAILGIALAVCAVLGFGAKMLLPMFGVGGAEGTGLPPAAPSVPPSFDMASRPAGAEMPPPPPPMVAQAPGAVGPEVSGAPVGGPAPATQERTTGVGQDPQRQAVQQPSAPTQPGLSAGGQPLAQPAISLEIQAEIDKVNKRLDSLAASLAALSGEVAKWQAARQVTPKAEKGEERAQAAGPSTPRKRKAAETEVAQSPQAEKAPPAVAELAGDPTVDATPTRKPGKKVADNNPKQEPAEVRPTGDVSLQAVLQDRAWFRVKGGETVTVGVGEEVPGVGVVRSIDVDAGRVTFVNGVVFR